VYFVVMDKIITRQDAKTLGLTRYFTGKSCPHGHVTERQTSSGGCIKCRSQKLAEWRLKNPDKVTAAWIGWRRANPEKASAIVRRAGSKWKAANQEKAKRHSVSWRTKYPEQHTASVLLWQKNNPEKVRASARTHRSANVEAARLREKEWRIKNPDARKALNIKRRARKLSAPGHYSQADIHRILAEQDGKCAAAHCGCDIASSYTIDHISPLSRGGSNWPDNIQLLCRPCNSSKAARTMDEWKEFISKHRPAHFRRESR
jgi:5-methylcytosine-specific restriction endonuclease McrA